MGVILSTGIILLYALPFFVIRHIAGLIVSRWRGKRHVMDTGESSMLFLAGYVLSGLFCAVAEHVGKQAAMAEPGLAEVVATIVAWPYELVMIIVWTGIPIHQNDSALGYIHAVLLSYPVIGLLAVGLAFRCSHRDGAEPGTLE